ncbi:transcriptional regulator [Pseudonocardia sp. CNS-139]|nr:transcriptional regulator [Pseudonocardia sp. CNS-139]
MGTNPLGEFLRAHRQALHPQDVGLPPAGRRRTPGLRREELAVLAGISTDYYVRLEQGRERSPSDQVVGALARALSLDPDSSAHLHLLARPARPAFRSVERASPELRELLESWPDNPAFVLGRFNDVLMRNRMAAALYGDMAITDNLAKTIFLDPAARRFYGNWEYVARTVAANLRAAAGADVGHPRLVALVGELSAGSPEFRELWARHEVRSKRAEPKVFQHSRVGTLTLTHQSFAVNGAPGQQLIVYHAAPDSPSAQALAGLAGLAASPNNA